MKQRVREHRMKIADEKEKPIPNTNRIKHWEKEIPAVENLKREQQLKRKG